jgi:hypothetical protein
MRPVILSFLYLSSIFFTGTASAAGDYIVSPTGATNDQDVINKAIEKASERGGGSPVIYPTDGKLTWKGIEWKVRSYDGEPGGENNKWLTNGAYIDDLGRLHLTITKEGDTFYSSELCTPTKYRYGVFRWRIETPLNDLDPNVCLGGFTYLNDTTEIDIEYSKWIHDTRELWYSNQPHHFPGYQIEQAQPIIGEIDWSPSRIIFSSWYADGTLIAQYQTTTDIPAEDSYFLLQCWLVDPTLGTASGGNLDFVFSDFTINPTSDPVFTPAVDSLDDSREFNGNVYRVRPTGSYDNQKKINEAIEKASKNNGTVYLEKGVYYVNGPVIIKSNVHLTGDPNAIIRVSSTSSQWFKGQIGVICNPTESVHNVEISGFQIDGNIANLPKSYANSRSDTRHDCEKLILIGGWSSNFGSNIKIHDMKLYNAFSDGIYIRFSKGVACYNNFISNCQHEGIFFSCVLNGSIYGNKIAGITSDCARLDNCQNCKIHDNIFFAYTGDSFGAYKGGHNGLQIGNAGVSHGYDARNKPFRTKNIEVYNNIFSDPGLRAIWYHAGENVYIHDNKFVNADELETLGVPIGDISPDNPPTVEDSLTVFDLLRLYKGQTSINDYQDMIKNDPVKTQEDKKAFFSPVVWLFLLIVIILLYGIKINLEAAFRW